MFLRVTLLTLLIAASGSVVSADTLITCDGNVQRLTCNSGLISIQSAVFGRTSNSVCLTNNTTQTSNTNCIATITSTITEKCNGLASCEVYSVAVADPCAGTYKYYNISYTCVGGQVNAVCSNSYRTLACGNYTIKILNAIYGRTDTTTCVSGLNSSSYQNTSCYANVRTNVSSLCNGKTSCTLNTIQPLSFYNDSSSYCPLTEKYLTVSYACTGSPKVVVACGESSALLTCGGQKIDVLSANYGRTDSTTCSDGRPVCQISTTNCYQSDSLVKVYNLCQGQKNCTVPATNQFFSEPCYGTYKYLNIQYSCVN